MTNSPDNESNGGRRLDSSRFRRPGAGRRNTADVPQDEAEQSEATAGVSPAKRGIALMIDVIGAFVFSLVALAIIWIVNMLVPVAKILTQQTVIMLFMICRDFFFQGRGLGKNLMGLQVVDASTGKRPTLMQSIKRNILFFVPLIFMGLLEVIKFLPLGNVSAFIFHAFQLFCTVYVIVYIPAELWLTAKQADGRRIGDKLANTCVSESSMDFSKLI